MKIAYVFAMPGSASYKLGRMILLQLEAGTHGVDVVGSAEGHGRTQPGEVRVKDTVDGVEVGCFPDLYAALASSPPDQVITL